MIYDFRFTKLNLSYLNKSSLWWKTKLAYQINNSVKVDTFLILSPKLFQMYNIYKIYNLPSLLQFNNR